MPTTAIKNRQKKSGKAAPARMADGNIDVDLLLFFHAVSQNLSFTRAAKELNIDQSWLSHKIRQLEKIIGVKLFHRSTRSVELTAAGRTLCDATRQLAQGTARARATAQQLKQSVEGELVVGALPFSFHDTLRQRVLDEFITRHPTVKLSVVNSSTPDLIEHLRTGRIDLAFVSAPIDEDQFDTMVLRENRYGLLVKKSHCLAKVKTLSLNDLSGAKIVVPARHYSPAAYDLIYKPAVDAGMLAVTTPEFECAPDYAQALDLPVICTEYAAKRYQGPNMAFKPLKALNSCRKYLIRLPSHRTTAQETLWDIVQSHL